jgi:hypothetical protein
MAFAHAHSLYPPHVDPDFEWEDERDQREHAMEDDQDTQAFGLQVETHGGNDQEEQEEEEEEGGQEDEGDEEELDLTLTDEKSLQRLWARLKTFKWFNISFLRSTFCLFYLFVSYIFSVSWKAFENRKIQGGEGEVNCLSCFLTLYQKVSQVRHGT